MIKKLAILSISIIILSCSSSESEQRQRIPDGTYRPSGFHAFINHGEENIPISLVKADTLYHLFYTTGTDEWGHLSSNNLLAWTPEISFPAEEDSYGEVVWDENNTTGLNAPWNIIQNNGGDLMLSYSSNGIDWTTYEGGSLLSINGIPSIQWNSDIELWILTVVDGKSISFFTSQNLMEWNSASTYSSENESKKATLLSDDGQWMLILQSDELNYQLGQFDGNAFEPVGSVEKFDQLNAELGAILGTDDENIFVFKNSSTNSQLPTFSTPLSISLNENKLSLFPASTFQDEIVGKRRTKLARLLTDGPSWFSFTIDQEFEKLEILISDASSEVKITWNESDNKIVLSGSALASATEEQRLETDIKTSNLKVDILIDHASVDLFFNDGKYANSILTLPDTFFSKIEVYLDGTKYDARGVLYDIGL